MAYRDENGRITIDDVAANADIQKIGQAQDILRDALSDLKAAQTEAENAKGETAQAIYEKAQELITEIQKLDDTLDDTIEYIRHVIAVYKAKDEELQRIMRANAYSAGGGGYSAGGGGGGSYGGGGSGGGFR